MLPCRMCGQRLERERRGPRVGRGVALFAQANKYGCCSLDKIFSQYSVCPSLRRCTGDAGAPDRLALCNHNGKQGTGLLGTEPQILLHWLAGHSVLHAGSTRLRVIRILGRMLFDVWRRLRWLGSAHGATLSSSMCVPVRSRFLPFTPLSLAQDGGFSVLVGLPLDTDAWRDVDHGSKDKTGTGVGHAVSRHKVVPYNADETSSSRCTPCERTQIICASVACTRRSCHSCRCCCWCCCY